MKNISKVYRNQSTVIPKDIVKKKDIENQTFVNGLSIKRRMKYF